MCRMLREKPGGSHSEQASWTRVPRVGRLSGQLSRGDI